MSRCLSTLYHQTVPQQKSHANNKIFAEALGETQFQGTFVSIGWFPELICVWNPYSFFLFSTTYLEQEATQSMSSLSHKVQVKANRFHDSKNDPPVCIQAVQVSSNPVFVSTWITIVEWLCQYNFCLEENLTLECQVIFLQVWINGKVLMGFQFGSADVAYSHSWHAVAVDVQLPLF